ncbi:lycopene cyclase domain-containing protein [Demequina sp. SO4-13]|uniref:lycopene cyclase domain-containing protein n=1 Tax=Demequina sp. SO4-13 TaxID=3401027 RepID=UPI003AF4C886
MTPWLYLAALSVSLLGLGTLDWRYRVALFADAGRTVLTIASAVVLFLLWDLVGVGLGIFFRGDAPYMTGLVIAPEVPVEEVLFLTLLTYQTLLLWRAFSRRTPRTAGGEPA